MPLSEADEQIFYQQERTEWRRKQEIAVLKARIAKLEKIIVWIYKGEIPLQETENWYDNSMEEQDERRMREDNR